MKKYQLFRMCSYTKTKGCEYMTQFFIEANQTHHELQSSTSIDFQKQTYQIIVYGEVYNQDILFTQLQQFFPLNNTLEEVVFYAWKHWGMQAMQYLEGAYCFAISDHHKLIVCKDPMGLCPIYYTIYQDTCYVSNSISTILEQSKRPAILTQDGVLELFSFGPSISEEKTLFAGIFALPMGCYLTFEKTAEVYKYYELPLRPHDDSLEDTKTRIQDLLNHSIQQQSKDCNSSFLSGGLDSSIITAQCASKHQDWRTYSLDYEGNQENFQHNLFQVSLDTPYIDAMQKKYPTSHTLFTITQDTLSQHLEEAMIAREQPGMADVDASLLWLCKQVGKKDNIILSGECSDEIFGGYPWFYRDEFKNLTTFPWLRSSKERISLLHDDVKNLPYQDYQQHQYHAIADHIQYLDSDTKQDQFARLQTQLCLHWFMQTLVTRQVCEGKHAGVNIRAPFANVKLLEYVYNIPWEMKFYNGQEKGILRQAYADILPEDVAFRKKNPFPKTHNPKYAQLVADMLAQRLKDSSSPLHVLFNHDKLQELIDTKGSSFSLPWYGQLMSGPQLLAYLYQIDRWMHHFNIQLSI